MDIDALIYDLDAVRKTRPLVHNITNFVVMNSTANGLLALGASPVMAHATEEVEEMAALASALVINIGTLSRDWIAAMRQAMQAAAERNLPIIFDPVGAGATRYRTRTCHDLLRAVAPTVIRGNASEIMALVDSTVRTKGVDSSAAEQDAERAAQELARYFSSIVVVSGAVDLVTDGDIQRRVSHGHPLMSRVTGLGCTATALIGAFTAINSDSLSAAEHAMTVLGISGAIAAQKATGPGSLQVALLDALYNMDKQQLHDWLRS